MESRLERFQIGHTYAGEHAKSRQYTRPGQELEAAQRQHTDLSKLISAKVVTLHTILLGVAGPAILIIP
eukprot:1146038-Pelagomonas_calceolata.AAC.1